jgi:hypothetical protein
MSRSSAIAAMAVAVTTLATLAAPPLLRAQTPSETVYFTAPNNRILKVTSFPGGSSSTVVTDPGTHFAGLVVASEGSTAAETRIIVANTTKGGDIRVYSGTGAKLGTIASLKGANGVTVDSGRNVWAVNAHQGGADHLVFVPRTDTGYGTPVVRTVPGVTLLADVKFVSTARSGAAYKAGDLLVLAAKPAKILIFRGGTFLGTPFAVDFDGTEPAGLALAPEGEVLVTTLQRRILAFKASGERQATDFAALPGKGAQVAVGLQGGEPRVFATVTTGGAVLRYALGRSGSDLFGTQDGAVGSNVPFGVGNASLTGAAYTPASESAVSVLPLSGHEITFEKVKAPGVTSGKLYFVEESTVRAAASCDCPHGTLTIGSLSRCVPAYVKGYSRNGSVCDDDPEGDGEGCYYLVFATDTGANAFGSTQQHHFEEHDYGFETTCYADGGAAPDPKQPRIFYATDADDPTIVELQAFTDISTGCNSHIGRGAQFSLFLTGWDDRMTTEVATDKLDQLFEALTGSDPVQGGLAPYIDEDLLGQACDENTLANDLSLALEAWDGGGGDAEDTVAYLDGFILRIRDGIEDGLFEECPAYQPCRNAPGELIARAESAAFLVCGASETCQRTLTE